jgi:hypothetical protein
LVSKAESREKNIHVTSSVNYIFTNLTKFWQMKRSSRIKMRKERERTRKFSSLWRIYSKMHKTDEKFVAKKWNNRFNRLMFLIPCGWCSTISVRNACKYQHWRTQCMDINYTFLRIIKVFVPWLILYSVVENN